MPKDANSNGKEPQIVKVGHTANRHGSDPDMKEKGNGTVRDLESPAAR